MVHRKYNQDFTIKSTVVYRYLYSLFGRVHFLFLSQGKANLLMRHFDTKQCLDPVSLQASSHARPAVIAIVF